MMTTLKLKNTEKKLDALEEHVEELLAARNSALAWFFCVCEIGAVGATDACRFFFLGDKGALGDGVPGAHSRRCSFALACSLFWAFPARRSSVVQYTHAIERAAVRGASFSQIGDVR